MARPGRQKVLGSAAAIPALGVRCMPRLADHVTNTTLLWHNHN
jgi:hypothetical protein